MMTILLEKQLNVPIKTSKNQTIQTGILHENLFWDIHWSYIRNSLQKASMYNQSYFVGERQRFKRKYVGCSDDKWSDEEYENVAKLPRLESPMTSPSVAMWKPLIKILLPTLNWLEDQSKRKSMRENLHLKNLPFAK